MTLQNLPFFIHGFVKVLSNFSNGIQLIVNILADLSYYTKLKTRSCLTEIPKLAMREGISMSKRDHILLIRRHKSKWPKRDLILRVVVAYWIYIAQSTGLQQRLKMLWMPRGDVISNTQSRIFKFDKLTYRSRDKIYAFSQTTFSNAFSWMKIYEFQSGSNQHFSTIGSDNGLAPTRRQAFIWTSDG